MDGLFLIEMAEAILPQRLAARVLPELRKIVLKFNPQHKTKTT